MQLRLEVKDRVDEVFRRLSEVSRARQKCKDFQSLAQPLLTQASEECPKAVGLLGRGLAHVEGLVLWLHLCHAGARSRRGSCYICVTQVAARIVQKADMPDVVHAPASLGGFLKSGLGRFGLQVGGLSLSEVREVREVFENADDDREVIIGGTALLTPLDVYKGVLESPDFTFH
eukprot:1191885-Prorocentrum_minimum.AAC.2